MGSINISIRDDAYNYLQGLKGNRNVSYSDVILELKQCKGRQDVMKFFGVLKDKKDWKESEENMKSFRVSFNKRIDKK